MAMEGNTETRMEAHRLKTRLAEQMYGPAIAMMAESEGVERSYLEEIPPESNVLGFGYGMKWTAGGIGAERAVRVYVRTKLPRREVPDRYRVPDEIDGVPTDVLAVGYIRAAFPRPTPCGVSGGHHRVPFGTLGCLVQRNGTGRLVLSNNHVLANVNDTSTNPRPPILEPGRLAGGTANPPIARLTHFHPLQMNTGVNEIDAAVAQLDIPTDMTEDIAGIGRVSPTALLPITNMAVVKHGATTMLRTGIVDDLDADIPVGFAPHGVAFFHHQFTVRDGMELFADHGDSGSLVVEPMSRQPVGLLFAIANGVTYCNYIGKVISELGLTIL